MDFFYKLAASFENVRMFTISYEALDGFFTNLLGQIVWMWGKQVIHFW